MGWVSGQALALFTGLGGTGAVAYAVLALALIARQGMEPRTRTLLLRLLGVPIAICWAGLFAAASHLGTPANALYAFTGVGRSPLSNEVAAVVLFLFMGGIMWLYSFKREYSWGLTIAGIGCASVVAIAQVWLMGTAYNVETVPTWQSPLVPANLALGALCGGLSLAAALLFVAEKRTHAGQYALLAGSGLALLATCATNAAYAQFVSGIGNNIVAPGEMGAGYPLAIGIHLGLALAGLLLQALCLRLARGKMAHVLDFAGTALVVASTVVMRLPFYDAYLSVGF